MQKLLTTILLLCLSTIMVAKEIDITKSKGTNQEVITSLSPEPMDDTVKRGANIKITFDKKLKAKHLKKSIKLKYLGCQQEKESKLKQRRDKNLKRCNGKFKNNKNLKKSCKQCVREIFKCQTQRKCKSKNIKGKTNYLKKRDILKFNPHNRLRPGYYQVTTKGLKTEDNKKIKNIMYRFEVSKNTIESITLLQDEINLKEQESIKLTLQTTYKDGTTEDITKDINWIIGDATLVSIDPDGNLKALKAGETLVQAEYHGKVSKEMKVTITKKAEVINGYVLPPEPDEALNNSTMLGIDSNDNGVRDDVERKIIKTYQTKVKIEYMLIDAKITQEILNNPIGNADEMQKKNNRHSHCLSYLRFKKVLTGSESIATIDFTENNVFNTKARARAYSDYNQALSGGVYGITRSKINSDACDFDVDELLGGGK